MPALFQRSKEITNAGMTAGGGGTASHYVVPVGRPSGWMNQAQSWKDVTGDGFVVSVGRAGVLMKQTGQSH